MYSKFHYNFAENNWMFRGGKPPKSSSTTGCTVVLIKEQETLIRYYIIVYNIDILFKIFAVRRIFRNEERYYELLIEKSISNLLIFPYHLSDIVTKGMRVTPFNYYIELITFLLNNDKSYDFMPNFTAADCKYRLNDIIVNHF